MKCTLAELNGKYYGTKIIVDDGRTNGVITVWNKPNNDDPDSLIPSQREIDEYGLDVTVDDWVNNATIKYTDAFNQTSNVPLQEIIYFDSDHYESLSSYNKAIEICSKIENKELHHQEK